MRRPSPIVLASVLALAAACGRHEGPGEVTRTRVPATVIEGREASQKEAATRIVADPRARPATQILFGDLHVHTTYSADAFLRSLPMLQGEGAHPPADACDFARFCSGLDFWSINDHAEAVSPEHWQETKEAIRQCNAVAGDGADPDVVAFLGWEWTQVGQTPADHYGHKNVVLRETAEDRVPKRPISALSPRLIGAFRQQPPLWQRIRFPVLDWPNRQRYFDFGRYQQELSTVPLCPAGVDARELPADCHEVANTPQELYEKLAQLGFEAIVIPHGTTWGLYTPPGSTLDKQLTAAQHDPERQTLFEVYSGHGNSEEYRDWKAVDWDGDGNPVCPEPTARYEPCCWRAGELVRARCGTVSAEECERRVQAARVNYLRAGAAGRMTLPWTEVADWKDCGHCRDCFNPAFKYQPGNAAQYALAITNFDDPAARRRFRFGFLASSDNHSARPGTGYKEYGRRMMTEATGARDATWFRRLVPAVRPADESVPFEATALDSPEQAIQVLEFERQASFFMTGGLVGVHAEGRDRDAIWAALKRREVYGTSGERILLWFDLLNGPEGPLPMGSETKLAWIPTFSVRAVGSFRQRPGCPAFAAEALAPERLEYLCRGECYNPSDERHRVDRIEIVRIRAQERAGEPIGPLIEDPWRRYPCPPGQEACVVVFSDPDYLAEGREVVYYARAVQEPTPAVNAGFLRCTYDRDGTCVEVNPCYGDYRTPYDDDCLAPNGERAWSSPIYLTR
jgi:hypothetical protein